MTQFNRLIREKMKKREESFKGLGKAAGVSEAYAKHIVYSDIVPLSSRVVKALAKHYHIPIKRLAPLAEKRNRIGRRYYKEYRAKNAA